MCYSTTKEQDTGMKSMVSSSAVRKGLNGLDWRMGHWGWNVYFKFKSSSFCHELIKKVIEGFLKGFEMSFL